MASTASSTYDGQRLHKPGITTVVTSYMTYGVQPKIGDPTSTAFSDIWKMTQGHPLTYAKTLPMTSSDICKGSLPFQTLPKYLAMAKIWPARFVGVRWFGLLHNFLRV
uniref:Uncharacterized protein n=1 Tax=Oryza brachyantha TaxID=4533 RepID=J3N4N4_ORYBR